MTPVAPVSATRRALLSGAATVAMAAGGGQALAQTTGGRPLYKDPTASVAARVEDLLARMTLEEKVAQMECVWEHKIDMQTPAGDVDAARASAKFPDGLGMMARPSDRRGQTAGNGAGDNGALPGRGPAETAEYTNAVQRWAVEHTRLGIPVMMHEESLHGYVARGATSFPQAIGLASSFDPELMTRIFTVASRELRARGGHQALAPVVDVAREPRWGRIEETYGEDPYLCGEMGLAAVRGFQGETLPLAKDRCFATLKHMTGHGQPQNGTNVGPAELGEHDIRDMFLPPFEKCIKALPVGAVMPSYNEVDGVPSHANHWLLTKVLREEWGYKGLTVSDYYAIRELKVRHHEAADLTEAAMHAIYAGVDVETPDGEAYPNLISLVKAGRVPLSSIDTPVRRILTAKFNLGLFENPYVDPGHAEAITATPDAVALAREAATRTVVLLKNDKKLLPLNPKTVGRLLVLGTHAKDTPIGGYSDTPKHVVSILDGLEAEGRAQGFPVAYSEAVRITEGHVWGQDQVQFTDPAVNAKLIADAVEAAKSADTIVMVLGGNEQTSREAWADNHLGDVQSLELMGPQNDLAKAIFDLGKPTVVFLLNGRPYSVNLLAERADALIEGWYMGQETGHAAADILFGRANPGGKLPVSIARNVGQLPIFYNYKPTARRGYLDGTTTPLYPFGFGLSYTSFDVSAPRLAKATMGVGDSVEVEIDVANTGAVRGDEVVQLYIRDDYSTVTRPVLELKKFKRVTLEPGQRQTVRFTVGPEDLWFHNMDMQRVVEPGTFTLFAGPNSVDLKSTVLTVA